MTAQPIEDFLNPAFIEDAAKELSKSGFISDEHNFAPYRETLNKYVFEIEKALRESGHTFELMPGFLNHFDAGYTYYVYDINRFVDQDTAKRAVKSWLDKKYR